LSLFKKKEKVTLDQFIYQEIIQVENIINKQVDGLYDIISEEIDQKLLFASFDYCGYYIMNKFNLFDSSEEVGKRFAQAIIYYYGKKEYNKEYIEDLLDKYISFSEKFELYLEKESDTKKKYDYLLYLYVNKIILSENSKLTLNVNNYNDQNIIHQNAVIAEYTKIKLKSLEKVLDELFKFYEIVN